MQDSNRFRCSHFGRKMAACSPGRRTCPQAFTSDVCLNALRLSAASLAPRIEHAKQNSGDLLFIVDYSKTQDREALKSNEVVLRNLLLANPFGDLQQASAAASLAEME